MTRYPAKGPAGVWTVERLGALHWGLWGPDQVRPCPPLAQTSDKGYEGMRDIADRLNRLAAIEQSGDKMRSAMFTRGGT